MKIFIVMKDYYYSENEVQEIFASEEKATEYIEQKIKETGRKDPNDFKKNYSNEICWDLGAYGFSLISKDLIQ